jgi:phosphotransacetylase
MRQQEEDDGTASVEEKKRILLVEEDENQVAFAMRALRKHGIVDEVAVAGDGNEVSTTSSARADTLSATRARPLGSPCSAWT